MTAQFFFPVQSKQVTKASGPGMAKASLGNSAAGTLLF